MVKQDIIVMGASAGGVEALMEIVRCLPENMPAAIFIVLHLARQGTSELPQILSHVGSLKAFFPQSNQPIEHGQIYIAPNDHHLLVHEGYVSLTTGPRENGFRPSIDPLFRTAAKAYGQRVVSVVLTGLLDNGSAGAVAVKASGGKVIVQDPKEAMFSSMPESVMHVVDVDYILPLAKIPAMLVTLATHEVPEKDQSNLKVGNTIGEKPDNAETGASDNIYQNDEGNMTDLICPECGGVLVEFKGGKDGQLVAFECRVGHRYSLQSMMLHHSEATEAALWAAVRALEERNSLCKRMVEHVSEWSDQTMKQKYEAKAREANEHADVIRQILLNTAS
ncbi:MAG: chemotaxis protein CheB [Aggregatilineales bacterium]